jgi:hypothetical protein
VARGSPIGTSAAVAMSADVSSTVPRTSTPSTASIDEK